MDNNLMKSALAGVVGTTFMTAFSILTSEKKHRQFREYELLGAFLKNLKLDRDKRLVIGWIAHYITGVGFNMLNQNILKKLNTSPTFLNGLMLGAVNGAVGAAIWKALFEAHPAPPKIGVNRYIAHLMLAHLVFASLANVSMKKMTDETPIALSKV